jgi:hypothetical protein
MCNFFLIEFEVPGLKSHLVAIVESKIYVSHNDETKPGDFLQSNDFKTSFMEYFIIYKHANNGSRNINATGFALIATISGEGDEYTDHELKPRTTYYNKAFQVITFEPLGPFTLADQMVKLNVTSTSAFAYQLFKQ